MNDPDVIITDTEVIVLNNPLPIDIKDYDFGKDSYVQESVEYLLEMKNEH